VADFPAAGVYGRKLSDGLPVPPVLALGRPRTAAPGRIDREIRLSGARSRALAAFAAENGISIATLAQGAWALVLSRYCGAPDVVFVAAEGRRRSGAQSVLRRVRVSDDQRVLDWLRAIQAERDRSRLGPPATIEAVLSAAGWGAGDVETRIECREFCVEEAGEAPAPSGEGGPKLHLSLEVDPRLRVWCSADSAFLSPEDLERLLAHFTGALDGLAGDPERKLESVDGMSARERRRALVEFNRTNRAFGGDVPAHALIEAAVDRDPSATAVASTTEIITFGELEARANRLAARLKREGVAADVPVAVLLERSAGMVVAILAVLKAGAAYLPLDPAWPPDRIGFILRDAGVAIVLTQETLAGSLPETQARVVAVDGRGVEGESSDRPESAAAGDSLAYVIYTSGSAGEPKGVLVTHRGLVNYLRWSAEAYGVCEGEASPVHSPLAFDLTVTSLLTPLSAGRPVEMIPDREGVDGLVEALRRRKNRSVVKITPAHLEILASRLSPEEARGCARVFVIGGEALRGETLSFWIRHSPETRFVNEYGPTETVVGCCVQEVSATTWTPGPVPIGRPIANTRLYVLDSRRRPVPLGVAGELFIGGEGLARGYVGRADLTARSFVANPLPEEPGERLYRTGDLVRQREDGVLEYLGRADDQVKIRGYRIELGEIESVLRRHPSVRQAAVSVVPGPSGEPRLVGYFAFEGEYAPLREDLRKFLAATLPEYMIPEAFVEMNELPLTSNGKVDRRALPAPPREEVRSSAPMAAPRTDAERRIATIWSEILGIPHIGVDQSFFDLGGHSVLAARVFARMEETFGVRLPLSVLVEAPTVAQLASALEGDRKREWSSLVPLQPKGTRPPLYCFHPIGGNVVGYVDLARRLGDDQPLWGLQAVGLDGKRPRHKSIAAMAEHYAGEIRAFQPEGPYYLAGSSFGGMLAFAVAQLFSRQGAEVAFVGMFDTWGPDYRKREDLGRRAEWMARLRARVDLHWGNFLVARGPKEKARYVAAKAARVGHNVAKRVAAFRKRLRPKRETALARTLARVERSALKAGKTYVPKPYSGKLTLFRASRQPEWFHPDPALGWGRLAAGGLEIHEVPGHHGALAHEPRVAILAEKLEACLARARSSAPASRNGATAAVRGRRAGGTS
jgi:amino acid adenylation domain-containing protein